MILDSLNIYFDNPATHENEMVAPQFIVVFENGVFDVFNLDVDFQSSLCL